MNEAWALDPKTKQARVVTAAQWGAELKKDPSLAQRFQLVTKGTQKPLVYRGPYTRMGHEERVKPHFAYAAGHAPPQSHIFKREPESFEESVRKGKKVLLTLNTDLSHVNPDFRNTAVESCLTLEKFQQENEGKYVTYAIHDAADAVDAIKKIHGLLQTHEPKAKMDDRVFALYRGGVLPYHQFFLGDRREDIADLYDHMKANIAGTIHGQTRMIGMPRLIRFVPSRSTQEEKGLKGLKGAVYQPKGAAASYFSRLVFADENVKETPAYKALREQILQNKEGVYVLACPTITIGAEENGWRMMRWVINDIAAQTAPTGQQKNNFRPGPGDLPLPPQALSA
jgi:hypothetical protein